MRRFGLPKTRDGLYARLSDGVLAKGFLLTSESRFAVGAIDVGVSSRSESTIRKAFDLLARDASAHRRCQRFVRSLVVAPGEDSYRRPARLGLIDEDRLEDVVGALALYELGVHGWLANVGGLAGTPALFERADLLCLRACRRFYPEFLRLIGHSDLEARFSAQLEERQKWLNGTEIVKKRLGWSRVPKG